MVQKKNTCLYIVTDFWLSLEKKNIHCFVINIIIIVFVLEKTFYYYLL